MRKLSSLLLTILISIFAFVSCTQTNQQKAPEYKADVVISPGDVTLAEDAIMHPEYKNPSRNYRTNFLN